MVLLLDSRHPFVWRSPSSVQFGISEPLVVLENVTAAVEVMLAALIGGVTRPGLDLIAREAGADIDAVDSLLSAVRPALRPDISAPTNGAATEPPTVLIVGAGAFVDRLTAVLSTEGVSLTLASGSGTEAATTVDCDLAVVSSHFVLTPELHGTWLRRDIPHLSVVFSDSRVGVSPVVEPGAGPCLYCLERHHTDTDPAWPAIAAQLWGKPSRLESPLVAGEVAGLVARLILERVRRNSTVAATLTHTLDPATGVWMRTSVTSHPECGCVVFEVPAITGEESRRVGLMTA